MGLRYKKCNTENTEGTCRPAGRDENTESSASVLPVSVPSGLIQCLSVAKKVSKLYHEFVANNTDNNYLLSDLTDKIIGIAIGAHKQIGPGFREKYYQRAMYLDLQKSGLRFEREKKVALVYGKVVLGYHILDFVVGNKVVLELKSMSGLTDVEVGQLVSYLKLSKHEIGLLLNFGQTKLEIKRVKV